MDYLKLFQEKIYSLQDLKTRVHIWKFQSKKLVFTNGCFDLLHYGHIQYLAKARELGDKLIVGLNTDASVQRQNKGPERPLQNETSRSMIMAALHMVDAVVLFDEDTPKELIDAIVPHVLVKGADYKDISKIVGYDTVIKNGGLVTTLEYAEGYSTTLIEKKIKG